VRCSGQSMLSFIRPCMQPTPAQVLADQFHMMPRWLGLVITSADEHSAPHAHKLTAAAVHDLDPCVCSLVHEQNADDVKRCDFAVGLVVVVAVGSAGCVMPHTIFCVFAMTGMRWQYCSPRYVTCEVHLGPQRPSWTSIKD
jgi:hypothetical protein